MPIPDVEVLAVRLTAVFLMYSPDGMNIYGPRDADFECLHVGSVYGF